MTITDDKIIVFITDSDSENFQKITAIFNNKEEIAEKGVGLLAYSNINDVTIYNDQVLLEAKKEYLESIGFEIDENGIIDFLEKDEEVTVTEEEVKQD